MVVFSGFYESPGPPTSGNAHGIAPSHRHGYRKGLRRMTRSTVNEPGRLGDHSRRTGRIRSRITNDVIERLRPN